MIDTSAMVAALVEDHEHHAIARPHLRPETTVPAIVVAETFAQLRRTFGQTATVASALLAPWTLDLERLLPTTSAAVMTVLARASELDLGGNVHDALIAQVCLEHGVDLVTLDRRQHLVAEALGARSTFLLA